MTTSAAIQLFSPTKCPIPVLQYTTLCENMALNYDFKDKLTNHQMTNFRLFQTEKFADDNIKFGENGRKLSKQEQNTVGNGEIAHYEQFLLFPPVFSKGLFPRGVKGCHCVGMG